MNRQHPRRAFAGRCRGSLALEMMLVLVTIALGAWLVVEVVARVQQRRRTALFAAELRELAAMIQRQPPRVTVDAAALAAALGETSWSKGSAIGGSYEWLPARGGARGLGAIAVTAFAPSFPLKASRADLLRIDEEVDDGDLATGRFRTGFNGWPVYRVDDKR